LNVRDAVDAQRRANGSGSAYTELAQPIRTFCRSKHKKGQPASREATELVPRVGDQLKRKEVRQNGRQNKGPTGKGARYG
jgi:hypothetical protein